MKAFTCVTALAAAAVLVASASAKAPLGAYTVTDLGTLGGSTSDAYGINDTGVVVGSADVAGDAAHHAFVYSGGTLRDIGTLPGGANSVAYSVNRSGQAAGTSEALATSWNGCSVCAPTTVSRAFRYDAGSLTDLGGDAAPDSYAPPASEGYAIDDSGEVAGMFVASGSRDAVASYWDAAGARHPVGVEGTAYGISNGRALVGLSFGSSWLAQRGTQTTLPGGDVSAWVSINASGHVAYTGRSSTGAADAFLYISGSARDLGAFTPYGINGNDEVVGTGPAADGTTPHAYLYRSGKTLDLNTQIPPASGWTLEVARAINKSGQIVGTGLVGGSRHAFLLTPA